MLSVVSFKGRKSVCIFCNFIIIIIFFLYSRYIYIYIYIYEYLSICPLCIPKSFNRLRLNLGQRQIRPLGRRQANLKRQRSNPGRCSHRDFELEIFVYKWLLLVTMVVIGLYNLCLFIRLSMVTYFITIIISKNISYTHFCK